MAKEIFLLSLLLFAATIVLVSAVSIESSGIRLESVGKAPKFKLFDRRFRDAWYLIEMDGGLTETTPSGDQVKGASSFSSQKMGFSKPQKVVMGDNNVEAICLDYQGNLTIGANVKFTFCLPHNDTTVQFAGETIAVPAHSIKFYAYIQGWPFEAAENLLKLSTTVKVRDHEGQRPQKEDGGQGHGHHGHGNGTEGSGNETEEDGGQEKGRQTTMNIDLLNNNTALVTYPSFALADGQKVNCTVIFTQEDRSLHFDYVFPSFTTDLDYDPIFGFGGDASGDGSAASSLMAGSFLVAFFACLSVFASFF